MMCALFDTETLMQAHDYSLLREARAAGRIEERIDMFNMMRSMGYDETAISALAAALDKTTAE